MNRPPSTWVEVPLGKLVRPQYGKGLPAAQRNAGGVPVYGSAGVVGRHDKALVDGPVLIVGRKGNVGATYLAQGQCWPIDTTYFLPVPSGIDAKFLTHYLSAAPLGSLDSSTAVPSLRRDDLERQLVPIPPENEQLRIVAAIEEQFSRLDAAEDSLGRAKQMLVRLRNSVVADAVSGDWPTRRLDDVTESQIYGTSAKASRDSDGVPVLRMGNIRDGLVDFTDMKYLPHGHSDIVKCRLAPGDLLFNRTNSPELVGKSAVFTSGPDPTVFASYLIRVRLTNDCDPSWAALVINSEFGRRYVASVRTQQVGQANVNGTKLAAMRIPLPPIDVQRHILKQLAEWTSRVQVMAGAVENSRRRSALLRRSILDLAFSGGLVRQDTADEPASVLLERIATECATRSKLSRRRRRVPA